MRRRSLILGLGLLLLVLGVGLVGLGLMLRHEPGFYTRAAIPEGPTRQQQSKAFLTESSRFFSEVISKEPKWHAQFTETQINSFFAENFVTDGLSSKFLPEGVTAPRVVIEQDRLRMAFRYGTPPWSTLVSVDFKVWLPREPNVVILQLRGLHAGALPISSQSLLQQLSETLRKNNVDVTWYRHENRPSAVLRFPSNSTRSTAHLKKLELGTGTLLVMGGTVEPVIRPVETPPRPTPSSAVEAGVK